MVVTTDVDVMVTVTVDMAVLVTIAADMATVAMVFTTAVGAVSVISVTGAATTVDSAAVGIVALADLFVDRLAGFNRVDKLGHSNNYSREDERHNPGTIARTHGNCNQRPNLARTGRLRLKFPVALRWCPSRLARRHPSRS